MKINVTIIKLTGALIIIFSLLTSKAYTQNIDFGRSYINVTKGLNGGTVEPGDTLEIRASIVVKTGTFDSCSYTGAVPVGTTYIPQTICVLTNEGKIYKKFTDSIPDDAGWINGSTVRVNFGYTAINSATPYKRGRIVNTNRPNFNNTCIMVAAFRVIVTGAFNSVINLGAGSMTYKPSAGVVTTFNFPPRAIAIYPNYGICNNTIGTNSIGTEFNGTFGTGKPRNRAASANVPVGYTYSIFTTGGPNDYFYGIANNTSVNTGYTTLNNWPIPDNVHRVFGYWDIIGDHTGATNPILGNPAADTVANPNAGYMLVVNAAYRIDSAFQQTITGLCPNTYYEISCWMRNICSKCGNDSNAVGAIGANYIPTGPGDSSGVKPNLSFGVDGLDYYSTGNIQYTGKWIKKGFTFLTGAAQTSFVLKFFNNAPGGGGNDWALDDISVATCSPNLAFTPSNNPSICKGNVVNVGAYVRSFFNNYTFFKWQKSIDNGVTWSNTVTTGTGTPTWNGSAYEYFTTYPPFVATKADSGTKYKVVVASTLTNLSNANCSFTDATSILTLNIIDCGLPLSTDIISFSGKIENDLINLNWTSNREDQKLKYIIERSNDGNNFAQAGSIDGQYTNTDLNFYSWSESATFTNNIYYRIRLTDGAGKEKISRVVKISTGKESVNYIHVPNPFSDKLMADVNVNEAQIIGLQLIDNSGRIIRRQQHTLSSGSNSLVIDQTGSLPAGIYTLQLRTTTNVVNKRVMKQ